MIRVLFHSSPHDKKEYFKSVKSPDDVWLVSHLEAKRVIQAQFLLDQKIIASKTVQRASEYWHWLFAVNCPDWTVVSESLIFALIEEWFDFENVDERYQDISLFYNFFEQFLPVLSGAQKDLFEEWMRSDAQREERLAGWWEQSEKFWLILQERKFLPRPWILSILQSKETINYGTAKNFYVDLGTDIQQLELEFLNRIAEHHEVYILVPRSKWADEYSSLFGVYKKLLEQSPATEELPSLSSDKTQIGIEAYPSVVREVKAAVAQIRNWLDEGLHPSEIALLSPNIEEYWDLLREHFVVEGLPTNKRYMGKIISFPFVQTWLSRLHLMQKEIKQSDLENFIFDQYKNNNEKNLSYRDFKKYYSFIYEEDHARANFSLPETLAYDQVSLAQFIDVLYREWPVEDKSVLEEIADQFIGDVGLQHVFTYDLWLKYLEMIISRQEFLIIDGDEKGLWIGNVSHVDWTDIKKSIVVGCTQNNLREQLKSPALAQDIFAIENDLGMVLNRVEKTKKEFDLRWFLEKPMAQALLLRSHTDFEGQPQIGSSFWLGLNKIHNLSLPTVTRWDEVMGASAVRIAEELSIVEPEAALISHKIDIENNIDHFEDIQIKNAISLSASSLKRYFDCGFKFYANKVLNLKEPDVYDLDIDLAYQGQLLHAILEEIGRRKSNLEFSDSELEEIYHIAVKNVSVEAQGQDFWILEKDRHFLFVKNFLELERAWRSQFPTTKIGAVESSLEGYLGVIEDKVVISKDKLAESQFKFNGKVDRIDKDKEGRLGVIDYKTTKGSILTLPSWAKDGQFQMPLYTVALEQGLSAEVAPAPVVAASYIFLKEKKRGSGFILNDVPHEVGAPSSKSSKENVTKEKQLEYFNEIFNQIKSVLEGISRGHFPPLPRDFKICDKCNWRTVCRAPHLR